MTGKVRRTAEERRVDVIHAAIEEFGTWGYYAGSTERIAAAAGISQPYVLRLFRTKLGLFLETLTAVRDGILASWDAALTASPATGWNALTVMGEAYGADPSAPARFRVVLQAATAATEPEIQATINRHMDEMWTWVADRTGASPEEIQRFWAFGMMQTVGYAMGATAYLTTSERARGMLIPPPD